MMFSRIVCVCNSTQSYALLDSVLGDCEAFQCSSQASLSLVFRGKKKLFAKLFGDNDDDDRHDLSRSLRRLVRREWKK